MYEINLQLFNSKLKTSIFTICLKSFFCVKLAVLRKLRKKLRKTKISFHAQHFAKNIIGFAQIAQKNSAKLIAFHAQK